MTNQGLTIGFQLPANHELSVYYEINQHDNSKTTNDQKKYIYLLQSSSTLLDVTCNNIYIKLYHYCTISEKNHLIALQCKEM